MMTTNRLILELVGINKELAEWMISVENRWWKHDLKWFVYFKFNQGIFSTKWNSSVKVTKISIYELLIFLISEFLFHKHVIL